MHSVIHLGIFFCDSGLPDDDDEWRRRKKNEKKNQNKTNRFCHSGIINVCSCAVRKQLKKKKQRS